jgi:hypothetical protein
MRSAKCTGWGAHQILDIKPCDVRVLSYLRENSFAAPVVKIQDEHGQTVALRTPR